MLFSERKGFKPAKTELQIDSIDNETRNKIWNAFHLYIWRARASNWLDDSSNDDLLKLMQQIWHLYYKEPLDTLTTKWDRTHSFLREYFFRCAWFEVLDFTEFIIKRYEPPHFQFQDATHNLIEFINNVLEQEFSGYRIINNVFTEITSDTEINSIEQASLSNELIKEHINRALELMSDRKKRDYRNSIKESVSAVESCCRVLTGEKTLGGALSQLEKKGIYINAELKKGFEKFYAYTNDKKSGIRHAIVEDPKEPDFEDAKFMLVTCSAFVNYLLGKQTKVA